jgi:hypothetical protein
MLLLIHFIHFTRMWTIIWPIMASTIGTISSSNFSPTVGSLMALMPQLLFFTFPSHIGIAVDLSPELLLHLTMLEHNLYKVVAEIAHMSYTTYLQWIMWHLLSLSSEIVHGAKHEFDLTWLLGSGTSRPHPTRPQDFFWHDTNKKDCSSHLVSIMLLVLCYLSSLVLGLEA